MVALIDRPQEREDTGIKLPDGLWQMAKIFKVGTRVYDSRSLITFGGLVIHGVDRIGVYYLVEPTEKWSRLVNEEENVTDFFFSGMHLLHQSDVLSMTSAPYLTR